MANALSNLRREKGLHKTLTAVAAERITDGLVKLGHMAYHDFRTRINNLYHTGSGDRVRLKYFDETHIPARPSDQDQRHIIYTPSGLEMRLPDYNPPNSDTVAADHELSKTRFHAVARRHFLA
ncbi:uncharacterized protein JCM6883_006116 [Sporobolomyces salmoneus]|uniref:uncharacterized protein n=1 Tax=Sporobolomyces salmoneus TaxID=183962 RepID=UPI00317BC6AD